MILVPLVVDFLVEIESTSAARCSKVTSLDWIAFGFVIDNRLCGHVGEPLPGMLHGHPRLCAKNVHPITPPVERRVWRAKVATVYSGRFNGVMLSHHHALNEWV